MPILTATYFFCKSAPAPFALPCSTTQVVEEIKNLFVGALHLLTIQTYVSKCCQVLIRFYWVSFIALANITNHFDEPLDFLNRCCMECVKDLKGCCCPQCTTAPRLRPVLPGNQRYKKWYTYRELEVQNEVAVW